MASEPPTGTETLAPAWVWDDLPDQVRAEVFGKVSQWVQWLEVTYEPWVSLPPCWPLHESLRTELTMFWMWHRLVLSTVTAPSEGVRWHHELRRCAEAWRVLADCTHEPPSRHRTELAQARTRRHEAFLAQAISSPAPNPHRSPR